LLISKTNSKSEWVAIPSNLLIFEEVMKLFGLDGV